MSNVLLDTHNETIEKCEFNDLFTVSANIEKKVKSIEINENKKEDNVCIKNNTTNDKLLQVFYEISNPTFIIIIDN